MNTYHVAYRRVANGMIHTHMMKATSFEQVYQAILAVMPDEPDAYSGEIIYIIKVSK